MSAIVETPGIGHNSGELVLAPILCRIPQAAAMIGRGTRFIYEAIATEKIRAVKSDKRTLVVVASLREYAAGLPKAKIKPLTKRAHT